ncbi:hypothetical protein [Streptomyces sp. NPDC086787]|uniref:hypothetical protein n=1 Tax=Streptomyces sp. NPDC086787 TaxID=3365759 RepID=UPI003815E717
MSNSATDSPLAPSTVWAARGRRTGPAPEEVLRQNLRRLKDSETLDDFAELPVSEQTPERVFEARWRVAVSGDVTVRARLTLLPVRDRAREWEWTLVAEAESPWDENWPSPVTMFWPEEPREGRTDGEPGEPDEAGPHWDLHHGAPGLRLRAVNALPSEDKAMRRVIRNAAREAWEINLVVHEAMTPDEAGRQPLARLLPPGLRDRVVEHRAAPEQLRAVNWALRELGVWVPRGGAVIVPPDPAPAGYDGPEYSVRSIFLDGSEPTELIDVLRRCAALPKPMPRSLDQAVTALRERWTLLTLQEQLARERELVAEYSAALEAMTKSRDLYREAAEQAHAALAAYRDTPATSTAVPGAPAASPFQQLTRAFGRFKGGAKGARPAAPAPNDPAYDGHEEHVGHEGHEGEDTAEEAADRTS